jgi:peptidyl-prolyl cis-trans isomerase A (cyclophilin A)
MLSVCLMLAAALQAAPGATPAPAPAPKPVPAGPSVVIETSLGSIKVVLDKERAPISVDNFLRYVRAGFYNGTLFHRVIPGFMIQGGGLDKNLVEKPTRPPIRNEARNGLRNSRGTIAMARSSDPNSATAQFYINLRNNDRLDFGIGGAGYAVFGQVVEGMDVADRIAGVETSSQGAYENVPMTPVVILSIKEQTAARPAPAAKR